MKNKILLLIVLGILFFNVNGVFSQSVSFCCEKTTEGAWCQNVVDESQCDDSYQQLATSCQSTNFCKLGCCYDSQEGTCMENTPETVCQESGGFWKEGRDCEIPQCEVACCLMGDQAAFVTQTRCKRLSTLYGLKTTFRSDITDELSCLANAVSSVVKGACVLESAEGDTCRVVTQRECFDAQGEFHKDFLCTAESLGTICSPTDKTTCVEGKDEVYFLDSCGNVANIYDKSKINNKDYWKKIYTKEESCGYGNANIDGSCGNCDYSKGSTCEETLSGKHVCEDLSCTYNGDKYKHGESWCADSPGLAGNLPGSRAFRLYCFNGEVISEPCADMRQELCYQTLNNDGLRAAGCGVNLWRDCVYQKTKRACENYDQRDCYWIEGINLEPQGESDEDGSCVPLFAPGLEFWGSSEQVSTNSANPFSARNSLRTGTGDSSADQTCSLASKECVVVWEIDILGNKKCLENCECVDDEWEEKMVEACEAMGDCGSKENYLGIGGYSVSPKFRSDKERVESSSKTSKSQTANPFATPF